MNSTDTPMWTPLCVQQLRLANFRNHSFLEVEPKSNLICLSGANGAGKSSVLEAISLLVPGNGFRAAPLGEMKQFDQPHIWEISARVGTAHGDITIRSGLSDDAPTNSSSKTRGQRYVKINHAPAGREDLNDWLRVNWIYSRMEALFTGPREERRRFIDRLTGALNPQHSKRIRLYEKTLRARRQLLEQNADTNWISSLEHELSLIAVSIAAERLSYVSQVNASIKKNYGSSENFPWSRVELHGDIEDDLLRMSSAESERAFRERLRDSRAVDYMQKRSQFGPHRSDITVFHAQKNIQSKYCSNGEQKALLCSLVLAHGKLVAEKTGLGPITLIDDAQAYFDDVRFIALTDELSKDGFQTWITGTARLDQAFPHFDRPRDIIEL